MKSNVHVALFYELMIVYALAGTFMPFRQSKYQTRSSKMLYFEKKIR